MESLHCSASWQDCYKHQPVRVRFLQHPSMTMVLGSRAVITMVLRSMPCVNINFCNPIPDAASYLNLNLRITESALAGSAKFKTGSNPHITISTTALQAQVAACTRSSCSYSTHVHRVSLSSISTSTIHQLHTRHARSVVMAPDHAPQLPVLLQLPSRLLQPLCSPRSLQETTLLALIVHMCTESASPQFSTSTIHQLHARHVHCVATALDHAPQLPVLPQLPLPCSLVESGRTNAQARKMQLPQLGAML